MSAYVEKVLISGEHLLHVGRLSWWTFFGHLCVGFLLMAGGTTAALHFGPLSLLATGAGALLLLVAWVIHRSTELAITNKRIIVKRGFIRRDTIEINLVKVESLQVEQGILARMLNFGDIIIAAGGGPMAPVIGIANPLEFRRRFTEATDQQQSKTAA